MSHTATDFVERQSPLLIVGASARAAAQSARRAGFAPVCADLFADEDLRAIATVLPVRNYPQGLVEAARLAPDCPWIYTGALENHPNVIEAIARERPLWGNAAESIARIRDPFEVERTLNSAGLPAAESRALKESPLQDGRWMLKPIRSAGGHGIRIWDSSGQSPSLKDKGYYFQRRIEGESISALFVSTAGGTHLIGASQQLIGLEWLGARSFAYCGSLGPLEMSDHLAGIVRRIGAVLAESFVLRGLFGCDFVLEEHTNVPWLTEVNPRYTASVEIFEYALGISAMELHHRACLSFDERSGADRSLPEMRICSDAVRPGCVAKAILFADRDVEITGDFVECMGSAGSVPAMADVPRVGSRILSGHPVCTLLAAAGDEETCLEAVRSRVGIARSHLSRDFKIDRAVSSH